MRYPLALLLLLLACPSYGADYPARVIGISDGDTITVITLEQRQVKIRLWGIDAPESRQDYGTRAKQAASELAFGKTVTIRERDIDRYGRTVAEIVLPDGRSMGHEMVGRGLAWWFRRYAPYDTELAQLEAMARESRLGLWSQPDPIPPWEWRKGGGVLQTTGVVANRRSEVYHQPTCRWGAAMSERNYVEFANEADARMAGYRRAGDRW